MALNPTSASFKALDKEKAKVQRDQSYPRQLEKEDRVIRLYPSDNWHRLSREDKIGRIIADLAKKLEQVADGVECDYPRYDVFWEQWEAINEDRRGDTVRPMGDRDLEVVDAVVAERTRPIIPIRAVRDDDTESEGLSLYQRAQVMAWREAQGIHSDVLPQDLSSMGAGATHAAPDILGEHQL